MNLLPLLAWRPFLDPLPIDNYWMWTLLPLVIAVAIVYKTLRVPELSRVPRAAAYLTVQILVFMILAAAAIWLLVELV